MRGPSAAVLIGDGLTAVVLGQAAPHAMGLVGGECVERAGHPDGTPCTDRLGGRLPSKPGGHPLAIRRKEQLAPEAPARGVTPPGPRPSGPAIPGPLQALWRALPGVWWWSGSRARRTSGRPGHAQPSGFCTNALAGLARSQYLYAANTYTPMYRLMFRFCQGSTDDAADRATGKEQAAALRAWRCPTAASRSLLGRQPAACPARSAADCAGRHRVLLQVLPDQR
jgi:hypothetical protein